MPGVLTVLQLRQRETHQQERRRWPESTGVRVKLDWDARCTVPRGEVLAGK